MKQMIRVGGTIDPHPSCYMDNIAIHLPARRTGIIAGILPSTKLTIRSVVVVRLPGPQAVSPIDTAKMDDIFHQRFASLYRILEAVLIASVLAFLIKLYVVRSRTLRLQRQGLV